MLSLADHQRLLLAALKGRIPDRKRIRFEVEQRFPSRELNMLREVLLWWRRLGVSKTCPFTTAILQRTHDFDSTVECFVRATRGSGSFDLQGSLFLNYVRLNGSALASSVANTESALLRYMRDRSTPTQTISWPQDPEPVFGYLLRGEPLEEGQSIPHVLSVGGSEPGGMSWFPLSAENNL